MDAKKLMKVLNDKEIYVYGAGRNAARIFEYVIEHDKKVSGFIVTDMENNPATIFGIPVLPVEDYSYKEDDAILCSIVYGISDANAYREVVQRILSLGWNNVVFFSKNTFQPIYTWRQCKQPKAVLPQYHERNYHIDRESPVEANHSILVMEQERSNYRWRVEEASVKDIFSDIDKTFPRQSALEEFAEQYGSYISWQEINVDEKQTGNLRLLVYMTRNTGDRSVSLPTLPSWVIPIQVGASLTDKQICSLQDNQGENISDRNQIYSEGTAIYWMWKHAEPCDYIGLFHYRRHVGLCEADVGKLNSVDVLVTLPTFVPEGIRRLFPRFVPDSDIEQLLHAVEVAAPEYVGAAKKFFDSRFYPPCNLFVMKRTVFDKYASFVFSVTFEIEKYYGERNIYRYDRYMGYLVECLMGIFLMQHKNEYRIAYADMLFYQS